MINPINNSLLVAEQISKSYDKREVLKGINVSINQGTIVGFLGPNGSGKTTLFYIIAGLINPNLGRVLLDGEDITSYPMYKRSQLGLGYLPQDTSIFRGLNVEDNIDVILQLHCKDKIARKQKLDEILDEFKISHLRKNSSLSLSGGERRRVEIARTIASNPKFILLDEPFAGVDPIAVGDLKNIICILKTKGIGILITDHNVRETLEIVDKGYILYQGKILIEGKKEDIIDNKTVKEVYLGESFNN